MGYNSVAGNIGLSLFVYPLLDPNLRNPTKFQENGGFSRSRSSKVIDLGVSWKSIWDFLL